MQWLIDIIKEAVLVSFQGIIVQWSGLIADIPEGWALCDGTQGTPNLSYKFIFAVTAQPAMNQTGGASNHVHTFTANNHNHRLTHNLQADGVIEGVELIGSEEVSFSFTDNTQSAGTTNLESNAPPYYTLAFIMKL